jgi:hypothetical protein
LLWAESTTSVEIGSDEEVSILGLAAHGQTKTGEPIPFSVVTSPTQSHRPAARWWGRCSRGASWAYGDSIEGGWMAACSLWWPNDSEELGGGGRLDGGEVVEEGRGALMVVAGPEDKDRR